LSCLGRLLAFLSEWRKQFISGSHTFQGGDYRYEERGHARLPNHEVIAGRVKFPTERLSSENPPVSNKTSQVRKAGMPPLFLSLHDLRFTSFPKTLSCADHILQASHLPRAWKPATHDQMDPQVALIDRRKIDPQLESKPSRRRPQLF